MSTPQVTESPNLVRVKDQRSNSAPQVSPNTGGRQGHRRPRGTRAGNGRNASGSAASKVPTYGSDPSIADADGAVLSSEELPTPSRPRAARRHIQSQASPTRNVSSTSVSHAALTDSENPSATPAKAQAAYAGPTFHASPAASALPIPKFLSRSVPAQSGMGIPNPLEDGSDSASPPSPSPPSPTRASIPIPHKHENSALDMLFKADRDERQRVGSGTPGSVGFANLPHLGSPLNVGRHHTKQDSYSSSNAMFPIELDAENSNGRHASPPPVSLSGYRSITAPSRIPQAEDMNAPRNDSAAVQDLLSRLNQSQNKPPNHATPRTVDRIPSEPSSRHQTPSPFYNGGTRSPSGPTTPAPNGQDPSDLFYGNRNLSPMFQAAKTDSAMKRNSGLRTELKPDSPALASMGGFPPATGSPQAGPRVAPRNNMSPGYGDSANTRRGSVPHIPPYRGSPSNRGPRPQQRRPYYNTRPDSYPNAHSNNGSPGTNNTGKPKTMVNPFIPSSVQAKQYSTAPKPSDSSKVTDSPKALDSGKTPDSLALERDLKRMLNLKD
jgi:hypothetical protein